MQFVVTDLTRFNNAGLVCLAGIDIANPTVCVRPFMLNGNHEDYLKYESVKAKNVQPGMILETVFTVKPSSHKPHTEDVIYNPGTMKIVGSATSEEFRSYLDKSSVLTVRQGFGSLPVDKYYTKAAAPARSIITLKLTEPASQFNLELNTKFDKPAWKVNLVDGEGFALKYLKVTDLGFVDNIPAKSGILDQIKLNNMLKRQDEIYVRLGLGQLYAPNNDQAKLGHYLQINGIYSFPNHDATLRAYV